MDDSRFWLHKFRATAVTNWRRGGIDLRTVQMLLGHRSLESTLRYWEPMAGSDLHEKMKAVYAAKTPVINEILFSDQSSSARLQVTVPLGPRSSQPHH
jgi:integrase